MLNNWKRLSKGHYVDLNELSIEDIDIEDIEVSLNYIYRFNGHHKDHVPLTVAQHTLLCCILADMLFSDPKVFRGCLIHDFGEAYYGDITTPVKLAIGKESYTKITGPIDQLINTKFWYPDEKEPDNYIKASVKVCDLLSMDIERRSMWKSQLGKDKWPAVPSTTLSLIDKQALFEEVACQKYIKLGEMF